tara:strand:- start:161 stop:631 length:471 start_codon:yes stop_codon:yes gene_type:complete
MKEPYLDGLPTPSAFYDPKESCWRMSQATLLSEVSELLPNLPAWGTTANGALYELPTPEPLTAERDFSSGRNLPTLAARDYKDTSSKGPQDLTRMFPEGSDHAKDTLPKAIAHLLPTPAAGDCKTFGPNVDWEKRQNHAASVSSVLMNLLFDDGNK